MVIGLVSTIALAIAIGPQIYVDLQTAADDLSADPIVVEQPVSDLAEAPVADLQDEETVLEAMDETTITPDPILIQEEIEPSEELVEESTNDGAETEPAPAPVQNGDVPSDQWPAILADASAALSDAKTAKGLFFQTNVDGSVVSGTFALNRPGRMRFEYDAPTPVLIVSDGTTVAMEDTDLETVDRVPIGTTPLGLILSTQLNVDQDVNVLSVMQNSERIGIRVSDADSEMEGTLTMVFDKETYALLGWLAVDGNLQTTVVDLVDVETNIRIDPRMFRLNEDDDEEDER
ncbi:MAG: outer-membrane lipoprotein carrier protein LolA [Henriciella sp.]|nr:outer-membrane lipoprotein carrier protein LolA [Henriciella sp.]